MADKEKFGQGIGVVSGFDLKAAGPVDAKYTVNTIAERDAHITNNRAYEGMQVYCLEDKTLYIYKDSQFVKFDQSVPQVKTTVSVSGDVQDASFKVGESSTAQLALALKTIVTAGTGCKLTVNAKGLVTKIESLAAADIPALTHEKITDLGTAALLNSGTAAGNVVVVQENGKLADSIIPKIAITNTYEVDNESAMLALTAEEGDIAIRSDLPATFILKTAPASVKANWKQLATPTDSVLSVNGKTGTVVLTTADVAEKTNLYYTEERATANFNTNIAKTASTSLSDGANIYRKNGANILASDIVQDATHRFVTDAEKTTYADKYTKSETTNAINAAVEDKADKATTLAGYGITDAYTKTQTDSLLAAKTVKVITFTATTGWTELVNGITTLTLSVGTQYPIGEVYRQKDGAENQYEAVVVDIQKTENSVIITSMEKFAGYITVL